MNIEQNWKALNEQEDDDLHQLLQSGTLQKLQTHNPLQKIKRYLLIHIFWAVLVSLPYIFVLVAFPLWQVRFCFSLLVAFNVWAVYTSILQYKQIRPFVTGTSLLQEMEKHYTGINSWHRLLRKIAVFVYPVAAAGGFMLGGTIGSGKSIGEFLSKPVVIPVFIIVILVLVPVCVWLTKKMYNKSFGKHMAALKQNIDELKAVE